MRKLATILAIAVVLALPSHAAVFLWYGDLTGGQEIPPAATTADGFGSVRFDDVSNILTLYVGWQGLTGPGVQAHIHCCVATPPGNVGIALDLWLTADPRPASGVYFAEYDLDSQNPFRAAFTTANGGTALSAMQALMTAMNADQGRSYYNIHTAVFPGGEIRGNLAPIPEPASVVAMISGLGLLLLRKRFARS
jgi:hypothetical protein